MLVSISHLRQIDAPVLPFRHIIGGAVPDLALQHADLILVLLDGLRHEGFANRLAPVGKEPIECQRQSSATGLGQMSLQADQFIGNPGGFSACPDGFLFSARSCFDGTFCVIPQRLFAPKNDQP